MPEYRVVEKFISINGEGQRAGELAVFIRLAGCNMRCSYCDTLWALEKDVPFVSKTEEEIVDYLRSAGVKNVTLTGGEPLIHKDIDVLIRSILDAGFRLEIETNGSIDIRRFDERASYTVDYKCPGSGCESFMYMKNFENVGKNDTVKFVVTDMKDLDRMREVVSEYDLTAKTKVYVSTAFGEIKPADVADYMIEHKLNDIRLQLQIHKYIWDPMMRGV